MNKLLHPAEAAAQRPFIRHIPQEGKPGLEGLVIFPAHTLRNSPDTQVKCKFFADFPFIFRVHRKFTCRNALAVERLFRIHLLERLVEVDGAVDAVPVSDAVVAAPPTATPAQVAAPAVPAAPAEPTATEPPPPPAFGFELQNAEQFPENKLVRVFLYVFDSDQALGGYSVRVTKDGGELSVSASSAQGQPGLTWPIADSRQRFQNMKVEFPGIQPAGTWVVQLVDGGGSPAGPPATFNLSANDPSQELYVRYKKQ